MWRHGCYRTTHACLDGGCLQCLDCSSKLLALASSGSAVERQQFGAVHPASDQVVHKLTVSSLPASRMPQNAGPRAAVLRRLCASEAGSRLPNAVMQASTQLEAACGVAAISAAHRQLSAALQELHGVIVTVDHGLEEEPQFASAGAGECSPRPVLLVQ